MINLIPPSAKKQVRKEYWVRVFSVWMMLVASSFVIVAFLHMPTYVLIKSQLAVFANEFTEASVQNEAFKEAEATVVQSNQIATLLASDEKVTLFTTLIEVLETLAGSKVTINSFIFQRDNNTISPITISGQAYSRQSLVAFSEAIKTNKLFESAEIPLSNLAKDRDIPFTISVIPKNLIE